MNQAAPILERDPQLVGILPGDVDKMWPTVGPGIERMLKKGIGTHTVEQIQDQARKGHFLLFMVELDRYHLATIVATLAIGEKRVFEVGMVWGKGMETWIDEVYLSLSRVARELDCDSIAITGRRGWVRRLRDYGFNETMVVTVKRLK